MNERQLTLFATILLALAATESGQSREGIMYAPLCAVSSLDEFQGVLAIAASCGMLQRGSNFLVKITNKGRDLAAKMEKVMAENKAKRESVSI